MNQTELRNPLFMYKNFFFFFFSFQKLDVGESRSVSRATGVPTSPIASQSNRNHSLLLQYPTRQKERNKKLLKYMGVVYPGHGKPAIEAMIGGLKAISISFSQFKRSFVDWGVTT